MAKFIKFTNVQPENILGKGFPMVDEIILSTDQIVSINEKEGVYRMNTKIYLVEDMGQGEHIKFSQCTQSAIISKDDYENAKKILLVV